jgi:hypothetical protein
MLSLCYHGCMPKVKYDDAFRERINAQVLEAYGPVVTRLQLLEFKEKTGTFPVWIYRGVRSGRGTYQVPGSMGAIGRAVTPPQTHKHARRKTTERVVMPTPFDDGDYDTPEPEDFVPKPRESRTLTKAQEDKLYGKAEQGDFVRPVKVEAIICPESRKHPKHPYVAGAPIPKCEVCGTQMVSHWWMKPVKIDWAKYEAEHAKPKRGRKAQQEEEADDE